MMNIRSFNSTFQNDNDTQKTSNDPTLTVHKEPLLEIDALKSFEEYFINGNIEYILDKIEHKRIKKVYKKIRKSKSIYSRMNIANKEMMETTKERSRFFVENTAGLRKQKINIVRKNFFKTSKNLEKMIKEEKFNPEKFKDYYIKKYERNEAPGIFKKIRNFIEKVWKKNPNKTNRTPSVTNR